MAKNIYFNHCGPQFIDHNLGPGATFMSITGIDELWQEIRSFKTEITEPLVDQDYGQGVRFKIFTIKDLDENILRIGEQLK
jgi:hypothetical protein